MYRFLSLAIVFLIAPLSVAAAPAKAPQLPAIAEPAPPADAAEFGKKIPRTMALLAQSTPERRWPVKIVFYGQSITVQAWWHAVVTDLKSRFPHAQLSVENLAIGGYGFPSLRRTAEHDLYPSYPDLILLQAYGVGGGHLENLVAEIRRRTTAEIMLCTHHICVAKRRPDQDDAAFRKAADEHQARREDECKEIRRVAGKYGCELVEVRNQWSKYLQDNALDPKTLLSDHIHLSPQGCALMAKLVSRHFLHTEGATNPWSNCIETRTVQPDADGRLRVQFTGNRIDVIAAPPAAGVESAAAKVLIDGKPPAENPLLYAMTRPSRAPHAWYPAINRIGYKSPPLVEKWTLRIVKMKADGSDLEFELSGSETGPDGAGISTRPFISKSGRVVIDPSDWSVAQAVKWFKKPMPADFQVTWSVLPQFVDVYRTPVAQEPGTVSITTLAQGLAAGPHTLELVPEGNGKLAVASVRVHCPPAKDEAHGAR